MASIKGPYASRVHLTSDSWQVVDSEDARVVDFTNNKATVLLFPTQAAADAKAAQLSADDIPYRALLRAHYAGGEMDTINTTTAILTAIALLEAASFASDPAAVSAIATLTAALAF